MAKLMDYYLSLHFFNFLIAKQGNYMVIKVIESACTRCETGCFSLIAEYEPRFITEAYFLLTFL